MTKDDMKIWKHATKDVTPLGDCPKTDPLQTPVIEINRVQSSTKLPNSNKKYQAKIDLHGMTQNEAHAQLSKMLLIYKMKKYRCILVITGKGGHYGQEAGILKRMVPLWMEAQQFESIVNRTEPAEPKDGGEGGLYIFLRRTP